MKSMKSKPEASGERGIRLATLLHFLHFCSIFNFSLFQCYISPPFSIFTFHMLHFYNIFLASLLHFLHFSTIFYFSHSKPTPQILRFRLLKSIKFGIFTQHFHHYCPLEQKNRDPLTPKRDSTEVKGEQRSRGRI